MEEGLFQRFMKMGGRLLQIYADRAGNGDEGATVERHDKVLKRSRKMHARPYRSIFGVLEIRRYVYAEARRERSKPRSSTRNWGYRQVNSRMCWKTGSTA